MTSALPFTREGQRPLFQYWDRKRQGRRAPELWDVSPAEIPYPVQDNVVLIEIGSDGRLFVTVAGAALFDAWGFEWSGRHVDQLPFGRDHLDWLLQDDGCRRRVAPRLGVADLDRGARLLHWLKLPLVDEGGDVAMIMAHVALEDDGANPTPAILRAPKDRLRPSARTMSGWLAQRLGL